MTKLSYPATGVQPSCKASVNACARELFNAIGYCDFDIPSDFPYKYDLYNLSTTLNEYRNTIKQIDSILKSYDNSYSKLSENLSSNASKIVTSKINKRDRMIV